MVLGFPFGVKPLQEVCRQEEQWIGKDSGIPGSLALIPSNTPKLFLRLKTKSHILGRERKICFKNWLLISAL